MKEVKILMLHGYTQSGTFLRNNLRRLERSLINTLSCSNIRPVLIYPTGPIRLRKADYVSYPAPDYAPDYAEDDSNFWAWFRDELTGEYRFFSTGMATIASAIREAGGIDGCCGFSQGGCVAGILASVLQPDRAIPLSEDFDWARDLRAANGGQQLSFAVLYSGFRATPEPLQFCYEPRITTATMHVYGNSDPMIERSQSQEIMDSCVDPAADVHDGGHYVPLLKESVLLLAGFIKAHTEDRRSTEELPTTKGLLSESADM